MKKKIIGIFVCTLMIGTTIFPVIGQMTIPLNDNKYSNEINTKKILINQSFQPRNQTLDDYITTMMSSYHIPGLSATIVKNNNVFWTKSYGYANISNNQLVENTTLFYLASVSKTITATAIMQLWEQDYFELNDSINDYLPFEVNHPGYPSTNITFLMLMTHTSSIKDNYNYITYVGGDPTVPLGEFLEEYFTPGGEYYDPVNNFYSNTPGTYYGYSNVGASLLGYLVENMSGEMFYEYCENHIFEPLDMDETAWFLADLNISNIAVPYLWNGAVYVPYAHYCLNNVYPAANLRTSVTQLRNFLMMMINNGTYNSTQILQASTVELMLTVQTSLYNIGIIWFHNFFCDRWVWCHTGMAQGCRTVIAMDLETNIGVILFTNSVNEAYAQITCKLFNFAENLPPNIPSNPTPKNKETVVDIDADLSWTGGDPNGDAVFYDVYFGTSSTPPKVKSNQSETTYDPGTMNFNTTYYWRIVAWEDSFGESTTGPIWSFTTRNEPSGEPPNAPTIKGPDNGKPKTSYDFTFNAVDPDNNQVKYIIDWGDGKNETTTMNPSGTDVKVSHIWDKSGTYIIKAKAQDSNGLIGPESTKSLTIPRNKAITINSLLIKILEHFPLLKKILNF